MIQLNLNTNNSRIGLHLNGWLGRKLQKEKLLSGAFILMTHHSEMAASSCFGGRPCSFPETQFHRERP